MPELTIVFAGTPEFAATILRKLAASAYAPVAVYTQPDRPQGRGRKVKPNAVKRLARELNLPVLQPESLRNEEAVRTLAELKPDIMIVAAYGLILPPEILAVPTYGCINVHASLLPRWRGAAPIERAMMAGDSETGVCIMQMDAGLDTGGVYVSTHIPITEETTSESLELKLAKKGAKDLLQVLDRFRAAHRGKAELPVATPQIEEHATYAAKLTKADRSIDWSKSAHDLALQINALSARMPVRVAINGDHAQLLRASWQEQNPVADPVGEAKLAAGTVVDASSSAIVVQCAIDLLQITALKVERGKGQVLDPAAAINGFKDLFHIGARLV